MIEFFNKNKKIIIATIIIVVFLLSTNYVLAAAGFIDYGTNYPLGAVGWAVSAVLSLIAYILTAVIGLLITVVVYLLVQVAQYGNIINVPTVIRGWVIIRDLCNMLFILLLLIIAFATILRVESYNYKKTLPKLLLMAVLINFSRTIFGLMVDFSQVVMLTFVNSFREGSGLFMDVFRTNMLLTISNKTSGGGDFAVTSWSTSLAVIAGVIAAIITLIVVSIMLAILVIRIIMLWIYTIFSPLIFLGFAIPAIHKYTGRIWEDFVKQLVVGPVLAFFIWLALTTVRESSSWLSSQQITSGEAVCVGAGAFFCTGNFQEFIIVIGLLVGGLMVAQQTGGAIGSVAGKGMDWAKKVASVPHRGLRAARDYAAEKIHEGTSIDLNLSRVWAGIKEKRKEKQAERYTVGMKKAEKVMAERGRFLGALAMTGTPGTGWEQITSLKGLGQRFYRGGKSMARERKEIGPELELTKFQLEMSGKDQVERFDEKEKITKSIESNEAAIKQAKENEKKTADLAKDEKNKKEAKRLEAQSNMFKQEAKKLEAQNTILKQKGDFLVATQSKDFNEDERKGFRLKTEDLQEKYDKNIPLYDFEVRAADQKVVNEKMAKIKDVNEPSELLKILRDAIAKNDKAMFKAITKKMSQNYDDNEYLQPLVGDTSFKGLQELMRKISDKNDELYSGFSQQEAFSLGSELAYMHRRTNHWAASGAYRMENGSWREMSEQEHAAYRANEMGKMHPQSRARDNNRLAYGKHDKKGDYHVDLGGLKGLQTFDSEGQLKQFRDNIPESLIKNLATGDNMDKLREAASRGAFKAEVDGKNLFKILEDAVNTLALSKGKEDQYEKFRDIFEEKV